jgi:peptidoglycan/LPS O-acetylase OafA/YrhL
VTSHAAEGHRVDRFPALDGFRALAMLSVFFFHAWLPVSQLMLFASVHVLPFASWRANAVVPNLNIGVSMFFALSGFLIYRPFVAAHLAARASPNGAAYARRRGLRIYPAYWLVFVVLLASGSFVNITPGQILVNLALVQTWFRFSAESGIGQAWTLVVEVAFYAFVPLWSAIVRRGARRVEPFTCELAGALCLTAVGFGASWLQAAGNPPPWFTAFLPHLAGLGLGMVLAVVNVQATHDESRRMQLARIARYPVLWWSAAGALFWLTCAHSAANPYFTLDIHGLGWQEMLHPVVAGLLLAPLVLASPARGTLSGALAGRPIAWIGTVSYGAYLWHGRILDLGIVHSLNEHAGAGRGYPAIMTGTLLALVLTLLAGAASWYGLERPLLRLGQRTANRSAV